MTATEKARNIIEKFGTNDVFVIAERADVKIIYESWHPSTVGEFDKQRKTICVNRRAVAEKHYAEREIIAHELGHFFATAFDFDRKREEDFACQFADELTK